MARLPDTDLLRHLVGFDSTSDRSNLPLADFIAGYLDRPGVTIERFDSPVGPKTSLLIRIGPEPSDHRRGLVLCGHMDTVPAIEPDWTSDPFVLTAGDDRWVGRGTADMKGFLALAMQLANDAAPEDLRHPLYLLFTYDEEVGTLGARHLVDVWDGRLLPRAVLIGEPTSLKAARMNKGHLKARVTLRGRGAHSGYPHLGVNAIEKSTATLAGLSSLRRELETERWPQSAFFPTVPFVALNVATIQGGSAINVVPERCVIEIGVRLLPGMNSSDFFARLQETIAKGNPDAVVELVSESPPMESPDESELHRFLCTLVGQSATEGVSFATDGGWLSRLGVDCVLFGPGSIEVAHRPNEFIPVSEFQRGRDLLVTTVTRFCR